MPIDRYTLVTRHNPVVTKSDPFSPLSVGNGEFAFTADITGMQTFPDIYEEGIALGTQAQWGWHTIPVGNGHENYTVKDLKRELFAVQGRKVGYTTSAEEQEEAFHWLRQNPHRLHLGRIGLHIKKKDGTSLEIADIQNPRQELDLWKGNMESSFTVEECQVKTFVCCHPKLDLLAFCVQSSLFQEGRMEIDIDFPYGTPAQSAADWKSEEKHCTEIIASGDGFMELQRVLDGDRYFVKLSFPVGTQIHKLGNNKISIIPKKSAETIELLCFFGKESSEKKLPSFAETVEAAEVHWQGYWSNGGIVDFSGVTDMRANELERRVVLSQYLMAIQCAGTLPPQETGLTFNSWYGKFHLEMHWWHGVHFPLWGRAELFERSLWWYEDILPQARELAQQQGYRGVRWPKMAAYDGVDSPSPIGPLLIWQQPHPIYYAELLYQIHPKAETLERYQEIVFETAEFMATYAEFDPVNDRYVLGLGLIPAQENHRPQDTLNPTFELEYWAFGLKTANEWKKRLKMKHNPGWERVYDGLSELPIKDGVYLAHENCPDTYTLFQEDHPSMVGALGILSGTKVDKKMMENTLRTVFEKWKMEEVWGWDFPMLAMTAARLGNPELAINALLYDSPKNEYLINGHNKQAGKKELPIYLPGNGGLLTAIAMMAAGWRGCTENNPGFPKDGTWNVKWEGLHPML